MVGTSVVASIYNNVYKAVLSYHCISITLSKKLL
jgi:hypothetical protein